MIKGQFKERPRYGAIYYAMEWIDGDVVMLMWKDEFADNMNFKAGNCFKDSEDVYLSRPDLYLQIMGENADKYLHAKFVREAQ